MLLEGLTNIINICQIVLTKQLKSSQGGYKEII